MLGAKKMTTQIQTATATSIGNWSGRATCAQHLDAEKDLHRARTAIAGADQQEAQARQLLGARGPRQLGQRTQERDNERRGRTGASVQPRRDPRALAAVAAYAIEPFRDLVAAADQAAYAGDERHQAHHAACRRQHQLEVGAGQEPDERAHNVTLAMRRIQRKPTIQVMTA
jgi:hypothetical protein